jgi:predicted nucleic acid-binding protein
VLPSPIGAAAARAVLQALRTSPGHRFLNDDVSQRDEDVPEVHGYRQVTDAHLITLARRHGLRLVTFDTGAAALAGGADVELLTLD